MARDRDVLLGSAAALAGASLFGMLGVLTRFAADAGVGGAAFTAWRAILGVAFVALLILVRGRTRSSIAALRALPRNGRLALGTACVMGVVLNISIFTAFGLVPIALALMLFYTYPAGVAAMDLALGRERMTAPRFAALALSFTGVVLVLLGGGSAGGASGTSTSTTISVPGILLALTAAASQVVFVTVSRSGYSSVPADAATLMAMSASIAGAAVIALLVGQGAQLVAPFTSADPWPYLLLAGVAAAGISSMLFLTAVRTIGGTRTGILMLFEPVVGVVLAALLLGEPLGPVQLLGGLLVLAGALVLQLRAAPDLSPVAEPGAGPVV
jgi:drug/metabolite transporter (DMT)-like permease